MGDLDRKEIALVHRIGKRNEHLARWLLVFPACFDGRKFCGLVLEHVFTGEMPKEQLDGDQRRGQSEAPMEHHARFLTMLATQKIPRASSRNAHCACEKRGEQHVWPTHELDWAQHDFSPIRWDN